MPCRVESDRPAIRWRLLPLSGGANRTDSRFSSGTFVFQKVDIFHLCLLKYVRGWNLSGEGGSEWSHACVWANVHTNECIFFCVLTVEKQSFEIILGRKISPTLCPNSSGACFFFFAGRTVISVLPTDLRVIKGTTAALECNATHDSRVNIRYGRLWIFLSSPPSPLKSRLLMKLHLLCVCQRKSRYLYLVFCDPKDGSREVGQHLTLSIVRLQLPVGSQRHRRPAQQRRPCVCPPRCAHNRPDVVRWHWRLHLHCDVTRRQWFPHGAPWSHVSRLRLLNYDCRKAGKLIVFRCFSNPCLINLKKEKRKNP